MSEKRKTKRSKVKHAALIPRYNSRIRQEYMDMDYIHKLDDTKEVCELPDGRKVTEKEFMSLFMKEWNNAGVAKQSEAETNVFHRTVKEVKECTDRNNFRNRDVYGRAKAQNRMNKLTYEVLTELEINKDGVENHNYVEDEMVDRLDSQEEAED